MLRRVDFVLRNGLRHEQSIWALALLFVATNRHEHRRLYSHISRRFCASVFALFAGLHIQHQLVFKFQCVSEYEHVFELNRE